MIVHILRRDGRYTLCDQPAYFVRRSIRSDNVFEIANAMEDGNLYQTCAYEAGV